jgi:hypothetical protein
MLPGDVTPSADWSAYDEAMPHPGRRDLPAAVEAFAALRRRRGGKASALSNVPRVLVVVSSSRGGSTLVGELFRRSPGFLTLPAEINPLFVVAGLESAACDRTTALAGEIAAEIGRPAPTLPPEARQGFATNLAWRLTAQWPAAGIDPDEVDRWVDDTLCELAAADPAWSPPAFPDRVTFHLGLLARVRSAHPTVNPWYYDIPADRVREAFPDVPEPEGPPGEHLVEMPPFVLLGPWQRAAPDHLSSAPLILTTPRNAFRLSFIRSLFPSARMQVLHLVRNPAAAVNGLIDGWRHRGFFNTAVETRLEITGYSDEFLRWGDRWWNYDFWPGWEDWAGAPLAAVCAQQWRTHHEAVLDWVARTGVEHHRLRFDDVVGGDRQRRRAFGALAAWLDEGRVHDLSRLKLPPLMATVPPMPGRWARRAPSVLSAVTTGPVRDLADRLGCGDPSGWR